MNIIKVCCISFCLFFTSVISMYADNSKTQNYYDSLTLKEKKDLAIKTLFEWIKTNKRFPTVTELENEFNVFSSIDDVEKYDLLTLFNISFYNKTTEYIGYLYNTELPFDSITEALYEVDKNKEISEFIDEFIEKEKIAKKLFDWMKENGEFPSIEQFHEFLYPKLKLTFNELLNKFQISNNHESEDLTELLFYFARYDDEIIDSINVFEEKLRVVQIISEWIREYKRYPSIEDMFLPDNNYVYYKYHEIEEDLDYNEIEDLTNGDNDEILEFGQLLLSIKENERKPDITEVDNLDPASEKLIKQLQDYNLLSLFKANTRQDLLRGELQEMLLYCDIEGKISQFILKSNLSQKTWFKKKFKREKIQNVFIDSIFIPWSIENKFILNNPQLIPTSIGFKYSRVVHGKSDKTYKIGFFDNKVDLKNKIFSRISTIKELQNITEEDINKLITVAFRSYKKNTLEDNIQQLGTAVSFEEQNDILKVTKWIKENKKFPLNEKQLINEVKTQIYGHSKSINQLQELFLFDLNQDVKTIILTSNFDPNYWFNNIKKRVYLQENILEKIIMPLIKKNKKFIVPTNETTLTVTPFYSNENTKGFFDNSFEFVKKLTNYIEIQKFHAMINRVIVDDSVIERSSNYSLEGQAKIFSDMIDDFIIDGLSKSKIAISDINIIAYLLERRIENSKPYNYDYKAINKNTKFYFAEKSLINIINKIFSSSKISEQNKILVLSPIVDNHLYAYTSFCNDGVVDLLQRIELIKSFLSTLIDWIYDNKRFPTLDDLNHDNSLMSWDLIQYNFDVKTMNDFIEKVYLLYIINSNIYQSFKLDFILQVVKANHPDPKIKEEVIQLYIDNIMSFIKKHKRIPTKSDSVTSIDIFDWKVFDILVKNEANEKLFSKQALLKFLIKKSIDSVNQIIKTSDNNSSVYTPTTSSVKPSDDIQEQEEEKEVKEEKTSSDHNNNTTSELNDICIQLFSVIDVYMK